MCDIWPGKLPAFVVKCYHGYRYSIVLLSRPVFIEHLRERIAKRFSSGYVMFWYNLEVCIIVCVYIV